MPRVWPFGWWVGGVLDQHSRAVLGTAHWKQQPSTTATLAMLRRAIHAAGRAPVHLVTDRGGQFQARYRAWCAEVGISPRFGAARRHGSIATIERFWGSMKRECLRRLVVPGSARAFGRELETYVEWYNVHRPHAGLLGRTPDEVRRRKKGSVDRRVLEPRARMPIARTGRKRVGPLELVVEQRLGGAELPVVRLRHAA